MPPDASIPLLSEARALLRTERFGRTGRGFERVASTNTLAAEWGARGAPEGSVVVAEFQEAGRGRLGRTWEAAPGLNLMFSVVLRPSLPPERRGLITLAAGVAAAEAVDAFVAPLRASIKWPNDLLLEGRKCCGMLLETAGPAVVVLGVGLNVNQDAFPAPLEGRSTSLLLAGGRPVPRAALLALLLERLERRYDELTGAEDAVRRAYTARLAGLRRPVTLRLTETGRPVHGVFSGISETGGLMLDTERGLRTYHAGDVTTHVDP